MEIKDARAIEELCYYLKFADYPRAIARAQIDELFNGVAPYTLEEAVQNRIEVNVNWLDATRIHQDAARQFSSALTKPGNFFNVKLDSGPIHRRGEWGDIITAEINKRMKSSRRYDAMLQDVIAQLVLHGVGPVTWADKQSWCPTMHGMADVLIPSRTLLTFENLSHFAIYRRYTVAELWRKTHGPRVDKGWQMEVVEAALEWARTQVGQTITGTDAYLNPERFQEDLKSNETFYASDQVPTINCWDFYWLDDSEKEWGWKRRIILDCEATDGTAMPRTNFIGKRNQFLFNPGDRNYAGELSEILHCQFADGSVVAPRRYHSIRSIGWLLFGVCHLQNRLRCRFNEATFESLLQYFRVSNPDDQERLQKVDLVNKGLIPDGLNFIPQEERWQINQNLVQEAKLWNEKSMADNSAGYSRDFGNEGQQRGPEKTATQITAEVNATTAMMGSMLNRVYVYEAFKDNEICRRFCIKNSKDADANAFQAACLRRGVPSEMLDSERWNVSPVRVIGAGNKQLEISQTGMLMQVIDRYDPDAQRTILRDYTFAATDDPAKTLELVPQQKNLVNDSTHDAELSSSTLLLGLPMGLKQNVNHAEYAGVELGLANMTIQKIDARGGVATADEIGGLQNLIGMSIDGQPIEGNGAQGHIQILSQDKANAQLVKQLNDVSGKVLNLVKAMAQRLQEQQGQQQNGNGGLAPETAVELKSQLVEAESDAKIREEAAKQKMSHRDAQFKQKLEQSAAKYQLSNAQTIRGAQVGEAATDLKTAAEINRMSQEPAKTTE